MTLSECPAHNVSPAHRSSTTLEERLQQADLGVSRFVDLTDGTKKSYTDHRDSENQYEASALTGTYGVLAGKGLVIIDLDSYRKGASGVPAWIEELPDTYTVASPHGGEHRYYAVDGHVGNATEDWGEVRAKNQYVVGPGSVLDRCTKDWHDCSEEGEGEYSVLHDEAIAPIPADELPAAEKSGTPDAGQGNGEDWQELRLDGIDTGYDVEDRVEKAMNCAYGEKLQALWEGRYREAGYGDRSTAETALATYLAWWVDNDRRVVAALMSRSAAPKWADRDDSYRESVLDTACDHTRTYEPETSSSVPLTFEERPEVGWPCIERVSDALLELGATGTRELVEHDRVNRSERQVRRALDFLIEADQVRSVRNGRQVLYHHTLYNGEVER